MNWTPLYLNTPIPEIPKILNGNFTAFKVYIDIFYDGSSGILRVPLETSGRIKGARGEFVTAVVDNLIVKNQFTNLNENNTTADGDFYNTYTEVAFTTRDACIYSDASVGTVYWPLESSTYQYVDVNSPYYKLDNSYPVALSNNNLSQMVELMFDDASVGNDFIIKLDPSHNMTVLEADASTAVVQLICVEYDVSYGPSWFIRNFSGGPVTGYPAISLI